MKVTKKKVSALARLLVVCLGVAFLILRGDTKRADKKTNVL
jgi:hypothetical protein